MENEEKAAAIAAVMEYLRIFKISLPKKFFKPKTVPLKEKNLWKKSGRRLLMKKRQLMQMRVLSCKNRKYLFNGDSIGIYKD
ncbi:MAG: hypothetical protein RBR53_04215 [Desulforegulaceae bacterium]|nr:hypothetical protein [Desulforegulaceae bacterium]